MKQLVKSSVSFDQELHRYYLNGVRLSGITDVLRRHLFPNEYDMASDSVLENARLKGTFVHEVCEVMDELGVKNDIPEAVFYDSIKERYILCHEASEYLVSDNTHFASCIDKVYRDGLNEFSLGDIKTTSKFNEDYVRWQLSIYAYLFELQNPECKVVRLLGIWLREDKGKLFELERYPVEEVKRLLDCEINGTMFVPNLPFVSDSLPQKYRDLERAIIEIDTNKSYWERQRKQLMEGVMQEMVKAGAYSWKGDNISFTRRKDSIKQQFDLERFKEDHMDLYLKYLKDVPCSGSVTMKTNKK